MKMKKILALLMALTVACSALAACGEDDDSSSKKSKKNDSAVSTVDSDSDEEKDSEGDDKNDNKNDESKTDDSSEEDSSKEDDKDSSEDDKKDSSEDDKKDSSEDDGNNKGDASNVEGKWECEYMEFAGQKLEDFMGIPVAAMMQLEIKAGGQGVINDASEGKPSEQTFTWEIKGNKLVISAKGEKIEFEINGDRLVVEKTEGGQAGKVSLKKVDKFTEFDFEAYKDSMGDLLGDMGSLDVDDFNIGGDD